MPTKEPEDTGAEDDLDALLDDALNDFGSDQVAESSGVASASTSSPAQSNDPPPKKKGLAFDPLPKPKNRRPLPSAALPTAGGGFPAFPTGFGAIPPDIADQDDLSAGFQRMMAELAQVDLSHGQVLPPLAAHPPVPGNHDLAATLRALAANSSTFGADPSAQAGPSDPDMLDTDMLNRLSEQLSALGQEAARGPGGQEPPPEDMSGLVDGIMHQLLAKDVLYQPIQEIGARYPKWLADHRDQLSQEDFDRFSQQFVHIQEISQLYEQEPDNFPKLINLLQQMQSCGQPPQEIVDEMAPGLQFDSQGQPQLPMGGGLGNLGIPGLPGGEAGGKCCIQ